MSNIKLTDDLSTDITSWKPDELDASTVNYNAIKNNPAIREAAVRFGQQRLGYDLSEDEAIDEFIEHFRSFDVNELTAGADYNYVSGIAADAAGETNQSDTVREKAKQKLADYQLLYQTYNELPAFDAPGATLDYIEGLALAPSTYIGLIPGIGIGAKAGSYASTQAAKQAVKATVRGAMKKNFMTRAANVAAANPVKTTLVAEGTAGSLQNIAQQKTEMEINFRDDYSVSETALAFGLSGALPAAMVPGAVKSGLSRLTNAKDEELLAKGWEAYNKKNKKANKAAEDTILNTDAKITNSILEEAPELKDALSPIITVEGAKKSKIDIPDKKALDPQAVAEGEEKFARIAKEKGLFVEKTPLMERDEAMNLGIFATRLDEGDPYFALSFQRDKVRRVLAVGTEILKKGRKVTFKDKSGRTRTKTVKGLMKGERISSAISDVIRQMDTANLDELAGTKFAQELLEKYNLTNDDLGKMFMADVSRAAKTMADYSQASRVFRAVSNAANTNLFGIETSVKKQLDDIQKKIDNGDVRQALRDTEKLADEAGSTIMDKIRAADTVRLAAMTSQTATTFRNLMSGYTRVGLDTASKILETSMVRGLSKVKGEKVVSVPNDEALALLVGMSNTKQTDAIVTMFEVGFANKADQLFRELRDVTAAGKTGKQEGFGIKTARNLNALNTLSDNVFKKAAFVTSLKKQLNDLYRKVETDDMFRQAYLKDIGKDAVDANDFNLVKLVEEGKFVSTFNSKEGKEALDRAIKDALYFTYQQTPESGVGKLFIDVMHKAPFLTTSLVPFPRFIVNAMKFTFEYVPLLTATEAAAKIATGRSGEILNANRISKAMVGTGLLYGATAFRESEYAGEKWYEAKLPNGQTFDLRPFFPAAPFLYLGELWKTKRANDKARKEYEEQGRDPDLAPVKPFASDVNSVTAFFQALSGTQFKAGFGIYAIDGAIRDLSQVTPADYEGATGSKKIDQIIGNFAGNIASTYTIPFTMGQDLYNTFLAPDSERIVRQTGTEDLSDLIIRKTLSRLPGNFKMQEVLANSIGYEPADIYESPTREEPLRRTTPITRQAAGILLQERRTFFENEISRLGIKRQQITQRTGDVKADQIINMFFGEYVTDYIVPVLETSEIYKDLPDDEKKNYILAIINDYKQDIYKTSRAFSYIQRRNTKGIDVMARATFNKRFDPATTRKAIERYHRLYGKPTENKPYDYNELIDIATVIDKLDGASR